MRCGSKKGGWLGNDDGIGGIEHACVARCKRGHDLTQRGFLGQRKEFIAPDDEVGRGKVATYRMFPGVCRK